METPEETPIGIKKQFKVRIKQSLRIAVNIHPFIWLAFFALLAYWQIVFMKFGLKWDNIDLILPLRTIVSNSLVQGEFPFWNPYQQGGYPIFADMKSVFSPEIWLIGSGIGYSVFVLHMLFFTYVFVAGVSSFRLLNALLDNRRIATVGSVIYMLSGFIVQHGHDLSKVIAAAWLPFAFHFFLRLFIEPSIKNALLSSVFFYLLIASGYIPISIVLAYFVVIVMGYYIFKYYKQKDKKKAVKVLLFSIVSAILISLLILPQILSYHLLSGWLEGLDVLSVAQGSGGAFPFSALISLLLPFSVVKDLQGNVSDIEMRNIYFGIIPLAFFILACIVKKPKSAKYAIAVGLLFLIVSFGSQGYLHTFLCNYVPFLNLFPNSGYYNLFTILLFVLVAIWSYRQYFNTSQAERKKLVFIILGLIAIVAGCVIWAWVNKGGGSFELFRFKKGSTWMLNNGTFYEHVIFQGIIQVLFLCLLLFLLLRLKDSRYLRELVFVVIVIEMLCATQLQSYYTVVSNRWAKEMQREIARQSNSFLLPDMNLPVSQNRDGVGIKPPFFKNTNIFKKKVSFDGMHHFELKTHALLKNKYPKLAEATICNPVLYASTQVLNEKTINRFADDSILCSTVFVPDSIAKKAEFRGNLTYSVKPIKFTPNAMTFDITLDTTAIVVLQQSYFPGWKLYIDEQEVDVFRTNIQFMGTLLNKGSFRLEYKYDNPVIYRAWIFSFSLFLVFIALILLIHYSGNKRTFSFLIYLGFLSLTAGLSSSYQEVHQKANSEIARTIRDITSNQYYYSVINSDRSLRDLNDFIAYDNAQFVRLDSEKQLHQFINTFNIPDSDTLVLMNANLENPYSLVGFFERHYQLIDHKVKNHFQMYYFVKSDIREEAMFYNFDWLPAKWRSDSLCVKKENDNKYFHITKDKYSSLKSTFMRGDLAERENFIFYFSARVKLIDSSNVYLSIHHKRSEEDFYWHNYNFLSAEMPVGEWVTLSHSVDLPQEIRKGDSLSIYVRNPDSTELYIDDVLFQTAPFVFK